MTNNKDYLSQEEIDALLRQSSDDNYGDESSASSVEAHLSSLEQDALGEIGNITFGSAATALSTLLGKKVDITTPEVSIITREELQIEFPKPHVAVHVHYIDGFDGINLLVIKTKDAQVIADLMMGGDGTGRLNEEELEEISISAVQEAMNQMMGSSATSMSTIFNRFVNISPPGIDILNMTTGQGQSNIPPDNVFVKISFRLIIGDLIDSTIMQLLTVPFAKNMVSILMGGAGMMDEQLSVPDSSFNSVPESAYSAPPTPAPMPEPVNQQPQQPVYQQPHPQQPTYTQPAPAYMPQPHTPAAYGNMPGRHVNVQPAQFSSFGTNGGVQADDGNLNLLLDIPLKVTVELGRTQKVIKDILEITHGSIIELDKLAGEPVDILVNNKLIAKGEVVVIDENFGVRVTDIINQYERLHKLQ